MMVRAKRIYILMVEVNKFIFFFASRYFLKKIENMFFVFLSSYRNTRDGLGEREMLWEHCFLFLKCIVAKKNYRWS